ncbi:Transcription factor BTF3 [Aphelenchoides fujianensis]|nr:Transcription factor BTF3 [Aphelenchoides fujianensis]
MKTARNTAWPTNAEAVRTGGKSTSRRKKKIVHKKSGAAESSAGGSSNDASFVNAQADFAVGLLVETALSTNDSLILSPISIALALLVAYADARGDTRKEFESVFAKSNVAGIDCSYAKNDAYIALNLNLTAKKEHLFQRRDFSDQQVLKKLNEDTNSRTRKKIRNLLSSKSVDASTKLVLVNAVYFKVTMMKMKTKVNYAETADVQVLELPYAEEGAKFIAFLPKEKFGLAKLLQKVKVAELLKMTDGLEPRKVNVQLPRFKITSQFQLKDVLNKLGFSQGFTEQADFSGIANNENLMISEAIHKASIESNEQGSEAAAATGVEIVLTSFNPDAEKPLAFVADHPFLFVVAFHDKPLFSNEKGSEAAAATAVVMNRSRPAAPIIPPTFRADHPFLFVIAFHDKPLFVVRFVSGNRGRVLGSLRLLREKDAVNTLSKSSKQSIQLNQQDIYQFLFCLSPKLAEHSYAQLRGVSAIGNLDIRWRTQMGEPGRLQTSQLTRVAPSYGDLWLLIEKIPGEVRLKELFQVECRVLNCSERSLDLVLTLDNDRKRPFLFASPSGVHLCHVLPNTSAQFHLEVLLLETGVQFLSGIRITDASLKRTYEIDEVAQILVN